jgi:acyl-CoA thioesterase-2
MPQAALDEVVRLLDLEAIEENIFRGVSPDEERQRVFGGQVAGQALVAAARTVGPVPVHSLHAYFLLPGDPKVPILYVVDRIRDGRSFTTRRVVAIQHGQAIFNLAASFHRTEDGFEYSAPMPDVPGPDSADAVRLPGTNDRAIDVRYVGGSPLNRRQQADNRMYVWMRADGVLPHDPVLHTCLLAYASDLTLLDASLLPHGTSALDNEVMMASLDHAMWFHRPLRADSWFLYAQDTPSSSGGRGLARGAVYNAEHQLAASVVQEGLIRKRRPS